MKKTWYLSALLLALSCSKGNEQEKQDNCDNIVEVLDYHPYENPVYQTTAIFKYDDQGRIMSVKGVGQNIAEYTYYNDSIVLVAKSYDGKDISETYYLDGKKRITRTKRYNYNYKYDSEGFLISYEAPYGTTPGQIDGYVPFNLRYEEGNLVEVYTNRPDLSQKHVTFTYYDEENQDLQGYNSPLHLSQVIYDRNTFFLVKAGFFGRQSKNLAKTVDHHQGYIPGEKRIR